MDEGHGMRCFALSLSKKSMRPWNLSSFSNRSRHTLVKWVKGRAIGSAKEEVGVLEERGDRVDQMSWPAR